MNIHKRNLWLGSMALLATAGLLLGIGSTLAAGLSLGLAFLLRTGSRPEPAPPPPAVAVMITPAASSTRTPLPTFTPSATPLPPADTATPLATATIAPPPSSTPAPLPTNSPSPTATGSNTPTDTPTPTSSPTQTPTPTPTPSPSQTATPQPPPKPSPTATATIPPAPPATATIPPTPLPSPTPSPLPPGRITGRVLLNGAPPDGGATLKLEDPAYNLITQTSAGNDGVYAFGDLAPSSQGYNVVFAQEWNEHLSLEEVVSWAWLGPVAVEDGTVAQLPDLEISPLGFGPISPEAGASFPAGVISPENPLRFAWTVYPQATTYWVDLVRGEEQTLVWQSPLVQTPTAAFEGALSDGTRLEPGEYWWDVGARRALGPYTLTVYGYLPGLIIEP